MPFESASWAVIVTLLPAAGLVLEEVTRYFAAEPATVVKGEVVPVRPAPPTPVTVAEVPATVWVVNNTVAMPLAFVVEVAVAKEPLLSDLLQVTITPGVLTGLSYTSES